MDSVSLAIHYLHYINSKEVQGNETDLDLTVILNIDLPLNN